MNEQPIETLQTEEALTIIGPEGEEMELSPIGSDLRPWVGIEKFRRPQKHYRLIWLFRGQAWLAAEDETRYRRKFAGRNGRPSAELGAKALADQYGAKVSLH